MAVISLTNVKEFAASIGTFKCDFIYQEDKTMDRGNVRIEKY